MLETLPGPVRGRRNEDHAMRMLFKQRLFSWFDSYDIFDEDGNTVYVVKGELSWGHRLQIYDAMGNPVGRVQERVLTFLPRFELYVGERLAINAVKCSQGN